MANENVTKQINLPGWSVEALKIACAAILAAVPLYVRFAKTEDKVVQHTLEISAIETKTEANKDKANSLDVHQDLGFKELNASLVRIEADVKELKLDFKNLRNGNGKP
jgi:hypothetical protein